MFKVIPAIDLREGKCVRLFKGEIGTETVYFDKPSVALEHWTSLGAKTIHVVDLDAATGNGNNRDIIASLVHGASKGVEIQVGGGIRDFERAAALLEAGVSRVVIGTAAITDPGLISQLSGTFSPSNIIVALDHKNEKVQVKGWTEDSGKDIYETGKLMQERGAGHILFSSVEADGAFTGPDIETTRKMVRAVGLPVLAAGGTRNLADINALRETGAAGVVIGKALYEGKIDLPSALSFS